MGTHVIELNGFNITWKRLSNGSSSIIWCTPNNQGMLNLPHSTPESIEEDIIARLRQGKHIPQEGLEFNYNVADDDLEDREDYEEFYNDPADIPTNETAEPLDFHGDFDNMEEASQDKIINPKHYKIFKPGTYHEGIEYTELCEALFERNGQDCMFNHLFGNAIKYITRLGQKDAAAQDLKKCIWYLSAAKDYLNKEGKYSETRFTELTETQTKESPLQAHIITRSTAWPTTYVITDETGKKQDVTRTTLENFAIKHNLKITIE